MLNKIKEINWPKISTETTTTTRRIHGYIYTQKLEKKEKHTIQNQFYNSNFLLNKIKLKAMKIKSNNSE